MSTEAFAQREHPLLVGVVAPQDAADTVAEAEVVARHRVVVATPNTRLSIFTSKLEQQVYLGCYPGDTQTHDKGSN